VVRDHLRAEFERAWIKEINDRQGAPEGMDIGETEKVKRIEPVRTPVPEREPAEKPAEKPITVPQKEPVPEPDPVKEPAKK